MTTPPAKKLTDEDRWDTTERMQAAARTTRTDMQRRGMKVSHDLFAELGDRLGAHA